MIHMSTKFHMRSLHSSVVNRPSCQHERGGHVVYNYAIIILTVLYIFCRCYPTKFTDAAINGAVVAPA
jgi:hypothetical protein